MAKKDVGETLAFKRDELLVAIGDRVKRLRTEAGLTQKAVGEAAGVSAAYIYLVETGGQNITITVFRRLATALGVSFDELLLGTDVGAAPSEQSMGHLCRMVESLLELLKTRKERDADFLEKLVEDFIARRTQDEVLLEKLIAEAKARRARDGELLREIDRISIAQQRFVEFFEERDGHRAEKA